jgi:hypothetical protein
MRWKSTLGAADDFNDHAGVVKGIGAPFKILFYVACRFEIHRLSDQKRRIFARIAAFTVTILCYAHHASFV